MQKSFRLRFTLLSNFLIPATNHGPPLLFTESYIANRPSCFATFSCLSHKLPLFPKWVHYDLFFWIHVHILWRCCLFQRNFDEPDVHIYEFIEEFVKEKDIIKDIFIIFFLKPQETLKTSWDRSLPWRIKTNGHSLRTYNQNDIIRGYSVYFNFNDREKKPSKLEWGFLKRKYIYIYRGRGEVFQCRARISAV